MPDELELFRNIVVAALLGIFGLGLTISYWDRAVNYWRVGMARVQFLDGLVLGLCLLGAYVAWKPEQWLVVPVCLPVFVIWYGISFIIGRAERRWQERWMTPQVDRMLSETLRRVAKAGKKQPPANRN